MSLSALALLLYVAHFTRWVADDFCAGAGVRVHGFWGIQATWLSGLNGRYTNAFVMAVLGLLGPAAAQWWPVVLLLGWFGGLAAFLRRVLVKLGCVNFGPAILLAALIVAVSVLATPYPFEDFYWESGSVGYTLPLVLATVWAGVIEGENWMARDRRAVIAHLLVFVAIAGLSEIDTAALIAVLLIAALASVLFSTSAMRQRRPMILAALAGSVLGLLLDTMMPGEHAHAHAAMSLGVLGSLQDGIVYGMRVLLYQFQTNCLLLFAVALTGVAVACSFVREAPIFRPGKIVLLGAAGVFGVFCVTAWTSFYALGGPPPERGWAASVFLLVFVAAGFGFLSGLFLKPRLRAPRPAKDGFHILVTAVMLWALAVFCYSAVVGPLPRMVEYATHKDRQSLLAGSALSADVIVPALGDTVHQGVLSTSTDELHSDPTFWVNGCEAGYYEILSIRTATDGGG